MGTNYEVIKEFGTLNDAKNPIEFNLVSWNGTIEKYDIRRWNEEGKPLKGITISKENIGDFLEIIENALSSKKSKEPVAIFHMRGKEVEILNDFGDFELQGEFYKKVTYTNWGNGAKYDIRGWSGAFEKCSKGITLKEGELVCLKDILIQEI